ncbi:MAG: DUF3849 domain-containing protein [Lachnospiraceae bacterium]|nr:DUF3849 domain-containing protein [Lachnospiraceae bacterium]
MEYPKLYQLSVTEARARDEIPLFRESHKLNIACKDAIEAAIRENFDGFHLNENCAKAVIEEYGFDRVDWVLANTVQQKDYDGRFSRDNKAWAKTFPVPESGSSMFDHRLEYIVESHPAVLDGFISLVRQEPGREKTAAEKKGGKRSIREQLSMPPSAGEKPQIKNKDREVR